MSPGGVMVPTSPALRLVRARLAEPLSICHDRSAWRTPLGPVTVLAERRRLADVRPGVQVRVAVPDDLDGLVDLCLEARAEAAVGAQLCSNDADRLRHQLGTLLAAPGGHALVGLLDGDVAGLLLGRLVGPSPFTEDVSLHVEALFVRPADRRRGLGHALLSGALGIADE